MSDLRAALEQHLRLAAAAYGSDFVLPAGVVAPRQPVAAPVVPAAAVASAGELAADATSALAVEPDAPAGTALESAPSESRRGEPVRGGLSAAAPRAAASDDPIERRWATLRAQVEACTLCRLHEGRKRAVFGEGNPTADLLLVGEAPGANEDRTGRPFVGDAGVLLTAILNNAMGLRRSEVYIANINKCRPPANRTPSPDEAGTCLPYLAAQVELIRPKVILCLGRTAAHHLLGQEEPVGALRGKTFDYLGIPVVVSWHPAYLLRDPSRKRETWADVMRVNQMLGRPERPDPVTDDTGLA